MAQKAVEGVFGSGIAAVINFKLGENDIKGITVLDVDLGKGVVLLDLEGETRNVEVLIDEILYEEHEMGIRISSLVVSVKMEQTALHKTWVESIINKGVAEYIVNNDGLWVNHHTKKMLAVFASASYATKI